MLHKPITPLEIVSLVIEIFQTVLKWWNMR